MSDFSAADILFVVLILGLIHGIMLVLGWVRRRKASAAKTGRDRE